MSSSRTSTYDLTEISYDPHSKFGLMLADETPSPNSDPLDLLIAAEEQLLAEFGVTLLQAVREFRNDRR